MAKEGPSQPVVGAVAASVVIVIHSGGGGGRVDEMGA